MFSGEHKFEQIDNKFGEQNYLLVEKTILQSHFNDL